MSQMHKHKLKTQCLVIDKKLFVNYSSEYHFLIICSVKCDIRLVRNSEYKLGKAI